MGIKEKRHLRMEGRRAHVDGKSNFACPHAPFSREQAEWLHGWWQREYEKEAPEIFKAPSYVPSELQ